MTDHPSRQVILIRYYVVSISVLAALAALLLVYFFSQNQTALKAQEGAQKQLKWMVSKKAKIEDLTRQAELAKPEARGEATTLPIIPFLEEEARRTRVNIRSIDQRPPIEIRRALLNRVRVITEEQTWIQVAEARLKDLVVFLHSVETQRPEYFVKELSSLTPNQGRGDSWRVRVILARLEVSDVPGSGPGSKN